MSVCSWFGSTLPCLWPTRHQKTQHLQRCKRTTEARMCLLEREPGDCPAQLLTRSRITANTSRSLESLQGRWSYSLPGYVLQHRITPWMKPLGLTCKIDKTRPIHPDVQSTMGNIKVKMNIWRLAYFFIAAGGSHHTITHTTIWYILVFLFFFLRLVSPLVYTGLETLPKTAWKNSIHNFFLL